MSRANIRQSASLDTDTLPYQLKDLQRQLQKQLLSLSYRAYTECIRVLLDRMGYTEIKLTGRTYQRGRTRKGGRDMEALFAAGLSAGRVVVQLKQYERPVQSRFVDELRGMMARTGASHGLIITTSRFPYRAYESAAGVCMSGFLPIRLVDGDELIDLLIANMVGIKAITDTILKINTRFFTHLKKTYPLPKTKTRKRNGGATATFYLFQN